MKDLVRCPECGAIALVDADVVQAECVRCDDDGVHVTMDTILASLEDTEATLLADRLFGGTDARTLGR